MGYKKFSRPVMAPAFVNEDGTPYDPGTGSFIPLSQKGAPGGVATLDGNAKVPSTMLPPLTHDTAECATEAAMLALGVTAPAICIRTDFTPPHIFFLTSDPASTLGNWVDTGEFGAGAANPSATVGLTVKNGVANTFLRSDGAPALDQGIAPTWTAQHIFTGPDGMVIVTGQDGDKLWLAKFTAGTGHGSAPTAVGPTSTYLSIGGREFGVGSFRGIGFGFIDDTTQNAPVWVGYEETDNTGNTAGDFVIATRDVNTNTAPTIRFRIDAAGQIMSEDANYVPTHPWSLAPKEYVDNIIQAMTYVPSISGDSNVSVVAAIGNWMYSQIGDQVTVSGALNLTPAASGAVEIEIFLPVPSNFTGGATLLSGMGMGWTGTTAVVAAAISGLAASTGAAIMRAVVPDTTLRTFQVSFTYTVV